MARRNKISVNAKYYKGARIERIANHNTRIERINYLLEKIHHKHKNINIVYNNSGDLVNKKYKFTPGNYLLEKFHHNQINLSNENYADLLKMEFYRLQQIKQQIQREKKSYTKPNENDIFEMVVALSEEQAMFYLENGIDLATGFDMYMKDLQDKYGFTPIGVNLHLDEGYINEKNEVKYNIHAHCVAFNYDFEKGKSVLRNLRKKDFQDMQTLAQDSFKKVGLDFVRGKEKTIAGKDHLEHNDYILQKQNKMILENNSTLEIMESSLVYLKEEIKDINSKKLELKDLLKSIEKGSEEYNSIYKEIGLIQQEEKSKRELLGLLKKEIDSFSNEKENIIENIKNLKIEEKGANSKLDSIKKEIDSKKLELSGSETKLNEIQENISKEEKTLETIKEAKKKVSVDNRDDINKNLANRINKLFKKRIKQGLINNNEYLKLNEQELKDFKKEVYEEFKDLVNLDFIVEDSKNTKLENFDLKARIVNLENERNEEKLKANDWIEKWKDTNSKLEKANTSIETKDKEMLKDSIEIKTLKGSVDSLEKQNKRALKFIKNKGLEVEFEKSKFHDIDR